MTLVKICGLTNAGDAMAAVEAGADYLGFVFARSPRQVMAPQVRRIMERVRTLGRQVTTFGVFLPLPVDEIGAILHESLLDGAQLHGWGSQEEIDAIRRKGFQVSRAFRIRDGQSVEDLARHDADYYLCDAWHPTEAGGTGDAFDHALIREEARQRRLILAGGLTPENVAEAIREVRPFAVDVSSGVEGERKGQKDLSKIQRFIEEARKTI
ncbi:phosphoribosylanthranilate isomerase [Candidatus Sumerlaeota bacterium]|nr:phosphoribosylanthranilate isomerase [Candidatus Sumerlaeota bacterium]